ncbi:MAG: Crp/Fnr family transcriptional regulator [Segetibacter sp.]
MEELEKELSRKFPQLEKELLKDMAQIGDLKTIKEGDVIIQSGQNIRSALLVIDGLVKIYREDEEGHEFFMYYLDAGKACALSLVCATKQETSEIMAKAVTETTLLAVPLTMVDQWMNRYKSWAHFALNSYRQRFEELLKTIDHIAFRNMDERLVFYLERHREKMNSDELHISFTQIAQELNSSREVISRLMKKLSDKGLVELHCTHFKIINLQKVPS